MENTVWKAIVTTAISQARFGFTTTKMLLKKLLVECLVVIN